MTRFTSSLAERMEQFVSLKRAMGHSYRAGAAHLRHFDCYLSALPEVADTVTCEMVRGWLSERPDLSPHTLLGRATVVRHFCLYLARTDEHAYVPDRSIMPATLPVRRPHIYSEDEVRALVRAARALTQVSLRAETVSTIVLLLYATGLRGGEVCRLRIADVDLGARTLRVEKSKFCKSRIVPFPDGLARELRSYFALRRTVRPADRRAPFFLNTLKRAFVTAALSRAFHGLVAAAGVSAAPGWRRPRMHDMRHTFAVHRLLGWYREGIDIEPRLPLLATYMGHVDVVSSQVYLTATAELLGEASGRFERAFGGLVSAPQEVSRDA